MNTTIQSFDGQCGAAILAVLSQMINDGEMQWTRHQVLASDEAARAIISRLPLEFRSIDTNHFRRIADPLEKRACVKGGFPHFTKQNSSSPEELLAGKFRQWNDGREHSHSDEYKRVMASPEHAENCRQWKSLFNYRCAARGETQMGAMLEIHHYNYDRLGSERDEDVCCVCSPKTGKPCHPLLDMARECKDGKVDGGLFA